MSATALVTADDEQRGGDGCLGGLAGEVDQHGEGEDGAAAAEQPEEHADAAARATARVRRSRRSRRVSREPVDDGVQVAGGAAVVGQFGQQHAHGAGVGQRGDGQAGAERGGELLQAGQEQAAEDGQDTRVPATRRTWRSMSQRAWPRLTGAACVLPGE